MNKRRSLIVGASVLAICLATAALADEPPSIKGVTPEQEFIFLAGAAQGIAYTNSMLLVNGKPQLFCADEAFALNVDVMRFAAQKELTGPHQPATFILAALSWLQKTYPCT